MVDINLRIRLNLSVAVLNHLQTNIFCFQDYEFKTVGVSNFDTSQDEAKTCC